jgi:hypothetical protein
MPLLQKSHLAHIARVKGRDAGSGLLDDADAFVPENPPILDRRQIAFQDVQVCSVNRCGRYAHDGIGGVDESGSGLFFPGVLARAVINKSLHLETMSHPSR